VYEPNQDGWFPHVAVTPLSADGSGLHSFFE